MSWDELYRAFCRLDDDLGAVKGDRPSRKEWEAFMRRMGFTRARARRVLRQTRRQNKLPPDPEL